MWAGGSKVTKLIILDDEALPASLVTLQLCWKWFFLHHLANLFIQDIQQPLGGFIFPLLSFSIESVVNVRFEEYI